LSKVYQGHVGSSTRKQIPIMHLLTDLIGDRRNRLGDVGRRWNVAFQAAEQEKQTR